MDTSLPTVKEYTIIGDLGSGAFADVYQARNKQGEMFALKMIRKDFTTYYVWDGTNSPIAAEIQFLREVDHPFILKLIEGFKDPVTDRWCMITELCKEDLRKPIRRNIQTGQTFDEETISNYFGMISSALDHLHDKKIIHRDIKPGNILVSMNGTLKLCDFGVAKLASHETRGTACGSIAYMAPEVWSMKPYDMKCDVWSLGVILYELCTLDSNFRRTDKRIPSRYSTELQDTVKLMLQENPAERPNIKSVCHFFNLYKKVRSTGSAEASEQGTSDKKISDKVDTSFLSVLDEDRISVIESDNQVRNIVHSPTSGTIYGSWKETVSGYKWDVKKKTFTHLFTCTPTGDYIYSLVLAPLHTNGTDQLYISVDCGKGTTKQVYGLGGREMEDKVLLRTTRYIDDKCYWWTLGSDPHKQILLINPWRTSVIYIHVKEQRHAKVDLNEIVEWDSKRWIEKLELIGRNLLLGVWHKCTLCMFDLVVTQEGASIKSDTKWGPVETYCGRFAALCLPMTDDEQQHKQLHLITAEWISDDDDHDDYTVLREYRVGLFGVGDVTHGSSSQLDCSSQPTQSLTVRGKVLLPHCVIHELTSCPILIGNNGSCEMFAIELDKH